MPEVPISYPARYAPGVALNFADASGAARQVSEASPLPVTLAAATGGGTTVPPVLSGSTTAALTVGPYVPAADKPLVLALSGTWTGSVRLLRSTDGGATRLPLSLGGAPWATFTANICEPVWEEAEGAAAFYLQLTPATGSIVYRLAQ